MNGSSHHVTGAHEKSRISVPWVLLASTLIGIGLACAILWLVTFNWWLFLGFGSLAIGAFMLFSPRAGLDRADDLALV